MIAVWKTIFTEEAYWQWAFFSSAHASFLGRKNSDKQDDPILLYPLGTTWYYHTSEKTSMDSPSYFRYIRHRVEKNIQIGEYQAQEIQVVHKDWTGIETPMEPFYLYWKGGKAYAVESDGLRLLYDLATEVGDVIPLPVNQGTAVEGFSHGTTTVIENTLWPKRISEYILTRPCTSVQGLFSCR